jgi:hypothetical protein
MFDQQVYVSEKLSEFERERHARPPLTSPHPGPRRRVLGPVVRAAGRRVRRAGELLESWGTPRPMAG